jgi:hypothetical protein
MSAKIAEANAKVHSLAMAVAVSVGQVISTLFDSLFVFSRLSVGDCTVRV